MSGTWEDWLCRLTCLPTGLSGRQAGMACGVMLLLGTAIGFGFVYALIVGLRPFWDALDRGEPWATAIAVSVFILALAPAVAKAIQNGRG